MEHDWVDVDAKHRQCRRCGLRLIWQDRQTLLVGQWNAPRSGWAAIDANGVPSGNLLTGSTAGRCQLVHDPAAPVVIIEYTGDPDVYTGCERFMHAIKGAELAGGSQAGLVHVGNIETACGWRCVFWELGPVRQHVGWTWCTDCFPDRGGKKRLEAWELQHRAPLPPPPPALPAKPKPRKPKKPKQLPGKP